MTDELHALNVASARELIRGANLRSTTCRVAVLQHLSRSPGPLSHADVADVLVPEGFDKSTIYRCLVEMSDAGLVIRHDLGDHVWRFEFRRGDAHQSCEHAHFMCTVCGKVECLSDVEVLISPTSQSRSRLNSQITEILLKGQCDACHVAGSHQSPFAMPRVGLFIPCYIDQLYPQVGLATVDLLERCGVDVIYPAGQTCCGQPMANTGCVDQAEPLALRFFEIFKPYEYVVCPSGSCTAMVRHHYDEYFHNVPGFEEFKHRVYELCEFLVDVLEIKTIVGRFPHHVGLHNSCHGLRELRLGKSSETVGPDFNKARQLLAGLEGIRFSELTRPDECCGFGGTFAVSEEAVSCMMGNDRIHDHEQAGTQILTANDMSCLMHLQGLILRQKKPIKVMHVAEILAEAIRESEIRNPNLEMRNNQTEIRNQKSETSAVRS